MPPTNYVLIDFENIQPKNMDILRQHPFKIFIFVGENQNKIPFETVCIIQEFGCGAKYIKMSGNGQNSLDFHIAYYIGRLSMQDPEGYFHIISKDTGFDPLVKHLRSAKIKASRVTDLAEIGILKISSSSDKEEKILAVAKNLAGRGQSRPRKIKTLSNTIKSLYTNKPDDDEVQNLIKALQIKKYISVKGEGVSYNLPEKF